MVRNKYFGPGDFENVQQRMEKMLENIFDEMRPTRFSAEKMWKPPVDIYETAEEVIVLVEVAGMNKKDIAVTLDNNILKISGVRPDYSPAAKNRIHQMEIDYGKFERMMKITIPIDTENTSACYKEGFLKITIPKKKQKQRVVVGTPQE
ncbi:MAG: Hsp20/alpha crystallin family protein [Thermodesulfobacteriota bacterium]|nr:Hsp20/alpha crystallin family protein [Thermodesulfobacteriota bacterium]